LLDSGSSNARGNKTVKLRSKVLVLLLATVAGAVAATLAIGGVGGSDATNVRINVASLASEIAKAARARGVDASTVVELGGSGAGSRRHAVLVGTDTSGAKLVSLLSGFGMSDFVAGDRFVNANKPMFVSDSVEGPSTEARVVGIVGITTQQVAHVTVTLANRTTMTLPLDKASDAPYSGFSYVSDQPATFPANVTGYATDGRVVARHIVDATPLCNASRPACVQGSAAKALPSANDFSNPGEAMPTLSERDIARLDAVGAAHSLRFLGSVAGTDFYSAPSVSGAGTCFGIGIAGQGIGSLGCPAPSQRFAFPSAARPLFDMSGMAWDPATKATDIRGLMGFAADGVANVGIIDAQDRIHTTTVVRNVYASRAFGGIDARVIVAYDRSGHELYRQQVSPTG
jgi:hypothetical protein